MSNSQHTPSSPFKFLDPYNREDRDFFFGREKEIEDLYEKVMLSKLFLIYGQSGTGKTSLIHCGLSNKFSETDWYSIFVRRNENIMDSLQRELRAHAKEEIPEGSNLRDAVESLYLDHYIPIYLIFDQFEELFIMGSKTEQEKFFEALAELLKSRLICKVVLIMREEYLAWFSDFEKIVPILFDNRYRIEYMNQQQLEEVISKTLTYPKFEISLETGKEEELVKDILKNLRSEQKQVDLTNLQVYLDRLYRKDQKRKRSDRKPLFDKKLIKSVGELPQVLGDFLDEQMSLIDKELGREGIALQVLMALVTNEGTKRSMSLSEIQQELESKHGISKKEVETCIHRFKEAKVLRELNF